MPQHLPPTLRPRRSSVAPLLAALLLAASANAQTTRVSVRSSGAQGNGMSDHPAISSDGRFVAFDSTASNLDTGDTNGTFDIFLRDRTNATTELVSRNANGFVGLYASGTPALSADGSVVAFSSVATNLVQNDKNGFADVFVLDRNTGVMELVSVDSSGAQGNNHSGYINNPFGMGFFVAPSLSSDGRYVAFWSTASNLVSGDNNNAADIFVRDRVSGTTERVSVDTSGAEGDGDSMSPVISPDGNVVGFHSYATNLVAGDTNQKADVFVHDRSAGTTESVSVDPSLSQGDGDSYSTSLSTTGQFVAFASAADTLVSGDTNGTADIFVRDRYAAITERVSVDSAGNEGDNASGGPSIAADGSAVAFWSGADDLVAGDGNNTSDLFVHDRGSGFTERVSIASSGTEGNNAGFLVALSADLRDVAFSSKASNLVSGDTNASTDLFVHERCITPASWGNYGSGFAGTLGVPAFTSRANPVLGSTLTLDLANSYGAATVGLLFLGTQRAQIHSNWGGDLLVAPLVTQPIGIGATGVSFTGTIPAADTNCGVTVDFQVVEADPGATNGVSFTAGLELVLGR